MAAVRKMAALLSKAHIYARIQCASYKGCSECPENEHGCHNRLEARYLVENGVALQGWEQTNVIPPTKEDGDRRGYVLAWNSVREYASTKTWHYVNARPDVFTHWMSLPKSPKEVE